MRDKPLTDRAADLERFAALPSDFPVGTAAEPGRVWQVRLGRTAPRDYEMYPDAGNVLPFVFIDAEFPEIPGETALTTLDRQVAAPVVGYSFEGWLPEGMLIEVFYLRNRWWIIGSFSGGSSSSGSEPSGSESWGSESSGSESWGSESSGSESSGSGSGGSGSSGSGSSGCHHADSMGYPLPYPNDGGSYLPAFDESGCFVWQRYNPCPNGSGG